MPIRCHAEHDGQGIVLSQIRCDEDAVSLCCFFEERGVSAAMTDVAGQDDFTLILAGVSIAEFAKLITGSNIELIE